MKKADLDWKIKESKKVISAAVKKWYPNIGIAFTGRKDSSVVMHLILNSVNKKIPCMFIDHGLHFDESYKHIKKLSKLWNLNIDYVVNDGLLKKLRNEKNLKKKSEIVRLLKIKTIQETIKKKKWKAMFTAIRWDEQPARANEVYFSKRQNHFEFIQYFILQKKIFGNIFIDLKFHTILYMIKATDQLERSRLPNLLVVKILQKGVGGKKVRRK